VPIDVCLNVIDMIVKTRLTSTGLTIEIGFDVSGLTLREWDRVSRTSTKPAAIDRPANCSSRGSGNERVDGDGRSERAYLIGAELHCLVHSHWRR